MTDVPILASPLLAELAGRPPRLLHPPGRRLRRALRQPQRRRRLRRRSGARGREPRAARPRRWAATPAALSTCYQIHSATRRRRRRAVRRRGRPRPTRVVTPHAGPDLRRARRRLRAGADRRPAGAASSPPSTPAGAARWPAWSRRRSTPWSALGRRAGADDRRRRPLHRPGVLRGRAGVPGRASSPPTPANARFFAPGARPDKRLFDLPGFVLSRLAAAGVAGAEWIGRDTCADEATVLLQPPRACTAARRDYGRLLSAIMLEA